MKLAAILFLTLCCAGCEVAETVSTDGEQRETITIQAPPMEYEQPFDSIGFTMHALEISKDEAIQRFGPPINSARLLMAGNPEDRWKGIQGDYTDEEINNQEILVDMLRWDYDIDHEITVFYHVQSDSIVPREFMIHTLSTPSPPPPPPFSNKN